MKKYTTLEKQPVTVSVLVTADVVRPIVYGESGDGLGTLGPLETPVEEVG